MSKGNTMKRVKQLFDLDSFAGAAQKAKGFRDTGGIILARNLEFVSPEIFEQAYAGLTFLQQGITVNNEGGWATTVRKLKLRIDGEFRVSGDSTNTTGRITLAGEDDSIPVFMLDAESSWTEPELKRAELENINLPSRFLEGHATVYNRYIDNLGYLGQTDTDGGSRTTGLLNYGWTSTAADDTAEALTGEELYTEIADTITAQWASVLNVEEFKADRFVMPSSVYNTCSTKILNAAGSEMSVLRALQANFSTVTFGMTTKAESVDSDSICVAFSSNRRAMQFRLPIPLNISNVYQLGHKYHVESFFGVAGLDVIEDEAGYALTGL